MTRWPALQLVGLVVVSVGLGLLAVWLGVAVFGVGLVVAGTLGEMTSAKARAEPGHDKQPQDAVW